MTDLPDLLTNRQWLLLRPHGCVALVSVEATTQGGQDFLTAYYDAIGQKAGGVFSDDEIEFPPFLPKEFDQLKRQASVVPLCELKDYPDIRPDQELVCTHAPSKS